MENMDKLDQPKDSEGWRTKKRALENDDDKDDVKKRKLVKAEQSAFLRRRALSFIKSDYLGPEPRFDFQRSFKISTTSFYRLKDDVLKSNIPYYQPSDDKTDPYLEAKLLLPLESFARGIPFQAKVDYYGMTFREAQTACTQFEDALLKLYVPERAVDSDEKEDEDEKALGVKLALKRLSELGFSQLGLL